MKFRQAKKIVRGNSSVYKKYRKRRPPVHEEWDKPDADDGFVHCWSWVYPSLHDIYIIRRAMHTFLHHYKRHKRKELG